MYAIGIIDLNKIGMSRLELLKNTIYQVVGENHYLIGAIQKIKQLGIAAKVIIHINDEKGSLSNRKSGDIIYGIKDLIPIYELSKLYSPLIDSKAEYIIDNNYSDYNNSKNIHDYISVECSTQEQHLVLDSLETINFLKEETLSLFDIVTIFSISYTLTHEIGHILYDNEIENQIERERKADSFAFEAIKSIIKNGSIDNYRILGAFLGIAHVLLGRTQFEEQNDVFHPHSIERLFALLESLELENNSIFWELAYNIVYKWHNKYGIQLDWENPASYSFKEKMTDACHHYKKE